MRLQNILSRIVFSATALLAATVAPVHAQQLVSINAETVNMRAAPSQRSEVLWQLGSGYPLKIVERKGSWLHVVDFEGDRGWVASRLTSSTPHYIVKAPRANLRAGPGTGHRIVGAARYGETFQVLDKRKSWVQVKGDNQRKGWIARGLLWGW